MFLKAFMISFLVIALSLGASATPHVREPKTNLAFATKINATGSANVVAADQARARALFKHGVALASGNSSSVPVTNTAVTYVATVGVGSPPTDYTLLIDTGSSNTWLGADKKYVQTKTSVNTQNPVSVSYGSGSFSGTEYTDQVTLSSDLVITSQSIGVASNATGFSGVDGILGIGPVDLTTTSVQGVSSVPTVTDNLLSQGTISTEVIGIYYAPPSSASDTNGELSFGAVDTSKTTSSVAYVPITNASPASQYWGIDQSIKYGSTSILSSTSGIVDTGTTLILLATSAFNAYQKATGASLDSTTGLLRISSAQYAALQPLNFVIGAKTYALNANAQIWPRALNTQIGGDAGNIYLVVANLGSDIGQGLDFINGYTFLERFYSVFDTTNHQVGFATTAETTATSN